MKKILLYTKRFNLISIAMWITSGIISGLAQKIFDDPCLNCRDSYYRGIFADIYFYTHFIVLISISITFLICIILFVFFILKQLKSPQNIFYNLQSQKKIHKSTIIVILTDILWVGYLVYLLKNFSMFGAGSLWDWIF